MTCAAQTRAVSRSRSQSHSHTHSRRREPVTVDAHYSLRLKTSSGSGGHRSGPRRCGHRSGLDGSERVTLTLASRPLKLEAVLIHDGLQISFFLSDFRLKTEDRVGEGGVGLAERGEALHEASDT